MIENKGVGKRSIDGKGLKSSEKGREKGKGKEGERFQCNLTSID